MPYGKLSFASMAGAEGGMMTDSVPSDSGSPGAVEARDFDGLFVRHEAPL
jgi:hypothetical protein